MSKHPLQRKHIDAGTDRETRAGVVGGVVDRPTGQCPVLVMCSIAALSSWATMASSALSRGGYT